MLSEQCASCHGGMLRRGAPMPLMSAGDFQALRSDGQSYASASLFRLRDINRPMPPSGMLSDAQLLAIETWLQAGAPSEVQGCGVTQPAPEPVAIITSTTGEAGGGSTNGAAGGSGDTGDSTGDSAASQPVVNEENRWAMFGHDLKNSRANLAETTLGVSNVSGLRRLWEVPVPSTTSTPAVVDGVVYLPAWDGAVYALNSDDGSSVWKAELPALIDSSLAVTDSRIFVSDDKGSLHALERASGALLWSQRVDPHPATHLWSSPMYIPDADLVVVGVASSEEDQRVSDYSFLGSVVALHASDGSEAWRFVTGEGAGAGVAVWATVAIDTDRRALYVGTGNAYQAPSGPLSDSMLAIDYQSGALLWSRQFTADDVFVVYGGSGPDFDIGSTANLFSAGGTDAVGIGVKDGSYYALDRDSGEVLWSTKITEGSVLGGVISASACDGTTIYVASNDRGPMQTRTVAINAADGQIRWSHDSSADTYGGLAFAGGVVYLGTTAGHLHAIDAENGSDLFTDVLPDSIAAGAAVAEGKLFVPWGYRWTLSNGSAGNGGLIAYGL